jgi:hypothetical protein
MSALLVVALAAGTVGPPTPISGRIDGIALVTYGGRLAVRINYTGRPGVVSVTRSGNRARVSLAQTELGWRFGSGKRFEWRPAEAPVRGFASVNRALEVLQVEQVAAETSLSFDLPADVVIDLKQVQYAILVVLREGGTPDTLVAQAPAPAKPPSQAPPPTPTRTAAAPSATPIAPVLAPPPPAREPLPAPEPSRAPAPTAATTSRPAPLPDPPPAPTMAAAATAPVSAPTPAPEPTSPGFAAPARSSTDLYRQLFPPSAGSPSEAIQGGGDDPSTLYARLFPNAPTEEKEKPAEETVVLEKAPEREEGFPVGPFRLRPTLTLSFVDADASLLATPGTVKDRYLQFEPGLVARAPIGDAAFTAEYLPSFRAGASFASTQDPTHVITGTFDVPFGSDSRLQVSDRFVASTLDSREVDPGGEYFFNLTRFNRNLITANARVGVSPRFFLEAGGALSHITFEQSGGFFPYDSRLASVGVGYEISPTLRTTGTYVYDYVPTPDQRPQAEASAHSAVASLQGDILPLLTGQVSVGYRDQKSPNAGAGGQRYQGLTMTGTLTRQFSRSSSLSLMLNRSTPVSNFEANGFYVSTSVQGALTTSLPWELSFDAGLAYAWSDYKLPSLELGVPREDRVLGLYAGLRRSIARRWWVSAFYRREQRRSNLDDFDTTSDGFLVQVNWGLFEPRR